MTLDLAVVVTTYNSAGTIGESLDSLLGREEDDSPAEVVVVDNASRDDSAALAASRPGVRLIRSERNLGLAGANNLGASRTSSGSILFLNPDATVLPGSLRELARFEADHPDAGVLGPRMLDGHGRVQSSARTVPSLLDVALRRTFLGRLRPFRGRLRRHMHPVSGEGPARADWLVGAALWVTASGRSRFGLMSERYFLYFEDVELCVRAWRSGSEVWYVPSASVMHVCRRASAGLPGRTTLVHLRSMLRFFRDHPSALFGPSSRVVGR